MRANAWIDLDDGLIMTTNKLPENATQVRTT